MKTFFQAERYDEQRDLILSVFVENNGRATYKELRRLGMSPSRLSDHLAKLSACGKLIRDDREHNGDILTTFYFRNRT